MENKIGCDIEQIERFRSLLEKESFVKGIFTIEELEYIKKAPKPHQRAAGIFCAKEAVAKALGRGLFGLKPKELEVFHRSGGQPALRLLGSAAEKYGNAKIAISISHSGEYAMAVCNINLE